MMSHLAVSAEPLSPPTVENLTASGVCFPTLLNILALQYLVMSWVTCTLVKSPQKSHTNSHLKVTKGPGTLGVYNSLWDSLPVEVCELLHEDVVLQQDGTSGAHSETVELVRHRGSMSCRQLVGELNRRLAVSRTLTSHISLLTPLLLFCLSSWLVAKSLSDIVLPLSLLSVSRITITESWISLLTQSTFQLQLLLVCFMIYQLLRKPPDLSSLD